MRFNTFKEFRQIGVAALADVVSYLRTDVADSFRNLSVGLRRLAFTENFLSFEVNVSGLAEGAEIRIRNEIREGGSQIVPKYFILVRKTAGAEYIVDGDTPWDENYVYLKNNHPASIPPTTATFTVIFFA